MNNEKGFTLIEMLIVLLIISVLLIITIPNLSENNEMVNKKGCEALVKLAEAQVQAYKLDNGSLPTSLNELVTAGYLEQQNCPSGGVLVYDTATGKVTEPQATP